MVRAIWRAALLSTCLALGAGLSLADDLPRKGSLGVKLSAQPGGVKIEEILNPALTDVKAGDLIVSVNGAKVATTGDVIAALGRPKAGDTVPLGLTRDGAPLEVTATLMAQPALVIGGKELERSHVTLASGARIRTELSLPTSDALKRNGKAPVLMMLGGITCITNETFATKIEPVGRLYNLLHDKGFAIYVVEKPGMGDSEGEPCATGGFDVEVEAFREAAKALRQMEGIDPDRIFAIGVSMGGGQVPLIAKEAGFKGIVTWGSIVMPWYDYMLASFRRRMVLEGTPFTEAEPILRNWRKIFAAAFVDGLSVAEIKAKMPEDYKQFEASAGNLDEFGGRSLKFAQECDKAAGTAGWQAYEGDLLALHGEYDWVAEEYDHRLAVHILNSKRPGAATFEVLPGMDHTMTTHPDLADSFKNFFKGGQTDLFETRITEWLVEKASL